MRTVNILSKVMMLSVVSAGLTGCPLSAQKETAPPAEEKPSEAAPTETPSAVETVEGDKGSLYEFFRRRVFINGKEVQFTGERKYGTTHAQHGHPRVRHAIASKLRMLLTDPRFDELAAQGGSDGDLLHRIIRRLFGFGGDSFTVSKVLLNVLSVQVRLEDAEEWQTVVDFGAQGQTIDLMALSHGALLEMGTFNLAPGKYTRVRLNLAENNKVEVDEGHGLVLRPLRTASRAHERIDLIKPFTVLESGLTTLTIDFDVNDSIRRWFGSYLISPKLKILSASTASAVKKAISAAQGGVVGVFGEIVVNIPPGALSEDAEVTLTPILRLTPHETADLLMTGHEYLIGPADVALLKPVTVALAFAPLYPAHVGVTPESLDLFVFDDATRQWSSSSDAVTRGADQLSTTITSFGRIGIGGKPLTAPAISGPGCVDYDENVAVQPTKAGLDLQYFAAACNHQDLCYHHGYRTYRQDAGACNDAMKLEALQRCEDLCRADNLFGKGCSQLSADELAQAQANGLSAALYENCLALADNLYQAAQGAVGDRYPGDDKSTCLDYDGKGVSCAPATCSVAVDKSAVKKGVPSDLTFTLRVMGSVEKVMFDGTLAYQQEGLALPIDQTITIAEVGRILDEPRTFTATVASPSGVPTMCSATVDVFKDPDPCTITVTPNPTQVGQLAGLFLKAAPGFDTATLDLKVEGTFAPIALGTPEQDGSRTFFANLRLRESRTFTAFVTNGAGEQKSCTVAVTAMP